MNDIEALRLIRWLQERYGNDSTLEQAKFLLQKFKEHLSGKSSNW
jgi:hypothetical protein